MSIHVGTKDVELIYIGKKAITLAYMGTHLIWEGIRSCFGRGLWVSEKPWLGNDSWKNNI